MKINDSVITCGEVIDVLARLYYDALEAVSNDSINKKNI